MHQSLDNQSFGCLNTGKVCNWNFLVFLLLILPVAGRAQFSYTTTNGLITITKYTGSDETVTIPDSIDGLPVVSVGNHVFSYLTNLSSILIPQSVTNMGTEPFVVCPNLQEIKVDVLNPSYSDVEGVLFNKNQTTLLRYPFGRTGFYTIPSGTTVIGRGAFFRCFNLAGITIPTNTIGIGDFAFSYCTNLSDFTRSENIASIGMYAFDSCLKLTKVAISDKVGGIKQFTFFGCTSLTNVFIGKSVSFIENYAFDWTTNLTTITVHELNPFYSSRDGVLFNKNQTTLILFPSGRTGDYSVPNTVNTVRDFAFAYGHRLATVTFPGPLVSIGSYAFWDCPGLTALYFKGYASSTSQIVFDDDSRAIIYYLPGLSGWKSTFAGRPTALWQPEIQRDNNLGVRTNRFGFDVKWSSGLLYVDACTNLLNPQWNPIGSVYITNGLGRFTDLNGMNYSRRYYRVRVNVP